MQSLSAQKALICNNVEEQLIFVNGENEQVQFDNRRKTLRE